MHFKRFFVPILATALSALLVVCAPYCIRRATFSDGSSWANPGFDAWLERYGGKTVPPETLPAYYPFAQPF